MTFAFIAAGLIAGTALVGTLTRNRRKIVRALRRRF